MKQRINQQQFAALWQAHGGIVAKVTALYARGAEDRRDLAQEIALQVWRSLPSHDPTRAKFSTWLYRVALNVAISHLRRVSARDALRTESLQAHHMETIGGGEGIDEPDARLIRLYACVRELGAFDRALILLYLEDRPHAEIAAVLGISKSNVATRIGRIKQRLRGRMAVDGSGE